MRLTRRGRGSSRHALFALALLALTVRLLVPAGFMPGTSLAAPIILCPDQGPVPTMAMAGGGHHHHDKAPHGAADHPCAFAGLGVPALADDVAAPAPVPVALTNEPRLPPPHMATPGRGMAAPPPPSHAPPVTRA